MPADQHAQAHHIRQVTFDLRYQDEPAAMRGRQQIEQAFEQVIAPLLEQAFDASTPDGQMYRIDRLEIDLGRIDLERLDAARIGQAIATELASRLSAQRSAGAQPQAATLAEALAHFLEQGSWPWQASFNRVADIEAAALALAPAESRRLALGLLPLLQRRMVRLRLAYQFSAAFLYWLIDQLRPAQARRLLQVAQARLPGLPPHQVRAIMLAVAAALPDAIAPSQDDLEQRIEYERARAALPMPQNGHRPARATAGLAGEPEQPSEPALPARRDDADVYVRHAGIVLLHPFLEQFFRQAGLIGDGESLGSLEQRTRAAHLLYHLSTGQAQPEEHELPLLKLLCGLPISFPLARDVPLSEREREQAQILLEAVIQHWAKLKQTSPAALRETFLQREGKLTQSDGRWQLVVEQRAVDLLLGYLPWMIAIIRLPWMAAPLWVDWA
jgi:contractile injection system tape measure protein